MPSVVQYQGRQKSKGDQRLFSKNPICPGDEKCDRGRQHVAKKKTFQMAGFVLKLDSIFRLCWRLGSTAFLHNRRSSVKLLTIVFPMSIRRRFATTQLNEIVDINGRKEAKTLTYIAKRILASRARKNRSAMLSMQMGRRSILKMAAHDMKIIQENDFLVFVDIKKCCL